MTYRRYLVQKDVTGVARISWIGMEGSAYVVLDQTWFHPQGGGQQADRGLIDGHEIIGVRSVEGEIRHYFRDGVPTDFAVGKEVRLEIDQAFRMQNSRLHSAGHLVAAVTENVCPGLSAIGGHHWSGEARVEFRGLEIPDPDAISELVSLEINRAIEARLPVKVIFSETGDRSIGIGEFPDVPCGGTHVENSADLKGLTVSKIKIKSGKVRISYTV